MTTTIAIRPAQPADKAPVLAFCQQTFAWGDYIDRVWDDWIATPDAELAVVTLADAPVGVGFVMLLSPDEAWYQGVRIAPAARRQGIGAALTRHCLHRARELGAHVMRTIVANDNGASQAMMRQAGMATVGTYVPFTAPTTAITPDARLGPRISQPGPARLEAIWSWLEHSNLAALTGGMLLDGWRAQALTDERLNEHLVAQNVWLLEEWGEIQALAIAAPRPTTDEGVIFTTHYIDGAADSIGRLLLHLRGVAATKGCDTIEVRSPDLLILFDALNGAGFTREDEDAYVIFAAELG